MMERYPLFLILLSLIIAAIGTTSSDPLSHNPKLHVVSRKSHVLNIETTFNLPSPLPTWPQGDGFATGTIDLGGLIVTEITTFNKIWSTYEGGPENGGATFFEPSGIPDGFFILGHYGQPNNRALYGRVLVGKNGDPTKTSLTTPSDYVLVWSSKSYNVKEDSSGYVWAPVPRDGYDAVGLVVTTTPDKPPLDMVRCVRTDLTTLCEPDDWIWGRDADVDDNEFNLFETRPNRRGKQASAVSAGTFMARSGGGTTNDMPLIACLKNVRRSLSYMPTMDQLVAIINTYAPKIYSHPDEDFLPASVEWFFSNGALLYKQGDESNPVPIDPTGSNLPVGGSNDELYWIDLPKDEKAREQVKKGDMGSATAYFHVKPMLGGTFTDLAIWSFYPFNGGSKAKIGILSIPLGKLGEHVGDWEHLTLRISNFNGMLRKVYFSQHASGEWVHASDLDYQDGNRFAGYSSWHGHACYPREGVFLQGNALVGLRNDTGKSDYIVDTSKSYNLISADYLNVQEPLWLNYARKWGPKITYDTADEINKVAKILPGKLKASFIKFTKSLPNEILGEQGPTGPKMKRSWDGDETK